MKDPVTLCELFLYAVTEYNKPNALLHKRDGNWVSMSHAEVLESVQSIAHGLWTLGLGKGDKVLLLSENRPEWCLCDYGILTAGGVTVPVYPTLHGREAAYIAKNSEASIAIVSTTEQAEKLLASQADLGQVRDLVVMDAPAGDVQGCIAFLDFLRRGKEDMAADPGRFLENASGVKPDDLASIVYTSGTTGRPKGVMLTHGNFTENAKAGVRRLPVAADDLALSFLPLSHVFERLAEFCLFLSGCAVAYSEGIERLVDNMGEIHPTIVAAVPRLFEKAYGRLLDQAAQSSGPKKALIHWSVSVCKQWAEAELEKGGAGLLLRMKHACADRIVPKALRKRMGGNIRFFLSGGAPLARDLGLFFYGASLPVLEGYGLTESSPVIALNGFDRPKYGSIGAPLDGVEVRIAEDGELLARGPNIMKGYYRNPEATAEVLTEDGWLLTGDIAHQDAEGYLYITDRKKEILVTAGGKNVAPQPIENALKMNKYVSQAILIGDGLPYIGALVHPNWENVLAYAESKGVTERDPGNLMTHPQVLHLFENVLERINRNLSRFEQIKRCRLIEREFTQEDGELTPTLKFKRRVILERYRGVIEEMYAAKDRSGRSV